MRTDLETILRRQGRFHGQGVNHEGQDFKGIFSLTPILAQKGISLRFRAEGRDGTLYHEEESVIGPTLGESLALWVISSNHPAVVQHDLKRIEPLEGDGKRWVFGIGRPEEKNSFREEVSLEFYANGDIGYRYAWGLPGGEFKDRSGLRMSCEDSPEIR